MRLNNKYINTPPNPLFLEGELNSYISMTYPPSKKRGLGGVLSEFGIFLEYISNFCNVIDSKIWVGLKFPILILLIFLFFNSFLFSQSDNSRHSRLLIFNKTGQKEIVKNGESISIVLGAGIKPEYSYLSYSAGKSSNEYTLELKSIETLLKEINNLRTSLESLKEANAKLNNDINNPEKIIKEAEKQKKRDLTKIDELQGKIDSLHERIYDTTLNKSNYTFLGLNKDVNNLQTLIDDQKNKIVDNKKIISSNYKAIHSIVNLIDEINESGKNTDKLDSLKNEFNSLINANNKIIDQNKILEGLRKFLNKQLQSKELDLKRLIKFLWYIGITAILFLVLASVAYWNYRQKKKFGMRLSEVNDKLEFMNLELNNSNTQLNEQNFSIQEQNKRLSKLNSEKENLLQIISDELQIASKYIISLIPKPIKKGKITTDWIFIPSEDLGGDAFGYNWIDSENFAIYLLDVSGHGVGPALHSVQVLNILQNHTLPNVDFTKPNEVLNALNQIFQMNLYNDYYFTMWYAVYNTVSATFKYSSAGHPPIIFVNRNDIRLLEAQNIFIGATKHVNFESDELTLNNTTTLYFFSDGVYEIEKQNKEMYTVQEFQKQLIDNIEKKNQKLSYLYDNAIKLSCKPTLDDDFSILKIRIEN
jgi:serine phosphatase RsbU (regulator of sigma subunit)